jgi:hypothetical protein
MHIMQFNVKFNHKRFTKRFKIILKLNYLFISIAKLWEILNFTVPE